MDVADWLRALGLQRYEVTFRENAVDVELLPNLTADDLKELGITPLGHRRRLLDAIAALRLEGVAARFVQNCTLRRVSLRLKLPRFRGVFDGFVDYGFVVTTSIIASYAIGERYPNAECSRTGLYQPSIKLKQAILASAWDANRRRSNSSHSSVAKKLSHMALS
jgi:hypothetical protein